jgi:predicted transcriptional regulator
MCPEENKSSGAVSVYIADDLRADLESYAASQERSVSFVIRKAIASYLAANGKPKEQAA